MTRALAIVLIASQSMVPAALDVSTLTVAPPVVVA
jgi:hypothetical protein